MATKLLCNNIETIAGDRVFLSFRVANYKLKDRDSVILTVKAKDGEANLFTKQVNKFSERGVAAIDLEPQDTAQEEGEYKYSIRVLTSAGVDEVTLEGLIIIRKHMV